MKIYIKAVRLSKRMTQVDLANSSGIDRSALSKIENGNSNFTITTLFKIAKALNCSVHELLD